MTFTFKINTDKLTATKKQLSEFQDLTTALNLSLWRHDVERFIRFIPITNPKTKGGA